MRPLQGIGVLVTRPELQAMPLCRLLEIQGASTVRLPAVEIRALGDRRALAAKLGTLERFDLIIFTSANAVRFGASFLDQKRDLTLATIGPATARALNQAGYRVALQPSGTMDSEGLLAHPRLEHISGHRILMVKGTDGRQLLQEELTRRGAIVVEVNVYDRFPAVHSAATLSLIHERFVGAEVQVVSATSLSLGIALLDMATPELREDFENTPWLVPSERIEAGLRARGLNAPLLRAESAEDQDLVAALIRWRSSASGA
jgi:uroporphyrinogen-III synthase